MNKKIISEKIEWIIAFFLMLAIAMGSYTLGQQVVSEQVENETIDVVLDAGHGGEDPGKVGINQALEKDINLEIVKKLETILKERGVLVHLTRREDVLQGTQVEDLQKRVKAINELHPQIAVSVHQNSYPAEEVKGAQVFYHTKSEEGRSIAEILQKHLLAVDPENHRQAKGNGSYYLLNKTEVPTVIVECGFLSNYEEAEKLKTQEYQLHLAEKIADGIMETLQK